MRGKHLGTRTLAIGSVLAVLAALGLPERAMAQSAGPHSGAVTITAERAEILQGIDDLVFTVTREFATGDDLDVTVTMSPGILPFKRLSHTVTIPADDTSATLTVSTIQRNPGAVTGDVTATVTDGPNHDVGDPSTASTHVHVGNGLITLQFSGSTMRVGESVGSSRDEVRLIARTVPNVPPPRNGFSVSVFTGERTAERGVDYRGFSRTFPIYGEPRGNWVADGDTYVSSTQVTVWPIRDDLDEDDETFAVQVQTLPFHPPAVRLVPPDPSAPPCTRSFCVSNVVIVDDDTRGVTLSVTGTLLVQEGDSESYTVVLDSQPTGDVMITPGVSNATDADISVSQSLTFTPSNWDRPQRVTVTAAADGNTVDGSATITHTVAGGDYGADGVTAAPVLVTIVDDDTRAVIVDQMGPLSVEEGGIATYTVVLDSEPTGDVTVTPRLTGAVDAEFSISPGSLTFTAGNWRSPQTVTVTAKTDGNLADGSATITHTVSGGDYEANRVTADSVPVVEQDAESGAVVVTITQVPDGTVLPDRLSSSPGETVEDGSTFIEGKLALFRLVFSAADGGPPPAGADVELRYRWHNESPIVPTSGERTLTVLSLPRVEHWDSAVQILDNDVGNPDGTVTIRITGCERTLCVIGEPSEITVTIADDDGGPAAAPPGQPARPAVVCSGGGYNAQGMALRVRWQAPDFVGGAPIEGYELRYRSRLVTDEEPQGGGWQRWPTPVTATSTVILGLEPDTVYGVQVRAVNANGPGQWSFESAYRTGEPGHICDILDQMAESQ